jgi:hypothetical protein
VQYDREHEQPHPLHLARDVALDAFDEVLVRQRAFQPLQQPGAEQDAGADDQSCLPGTGALQPGRFDAWHDQRERARRQHHAGTETEHGVLHALAESLREQHRQRAERGGAGSDRAAAERIEHARVATGPGAPQGVHAQREQGDGRGDDADPEAVETAWARLRVHVGVGDGDPVAGISILAGG